MFVSCILRLLFSLIFGSPFFSCLFFGPLLFGFADADAGAGDIAVKLSTCLGTHGQAVTILGVLTLPWLPLPCPLSPALPYFVVAVLCLSLLSPAAPCFDCFAVRLHSRPQGTNLALGCSLLLMDHCLALLCLRCPACLRCHFDAHVLGSHLILCMTTRQTLFFLAFAPQL